MSEPYAVMRPDEIYVPWGRPADQGPVAGIHADPYAEACAALAVMRERVCFQADLQLGQILWEVTARLRRLDEKIVNVQARREFGHDVITVSGRTYTGGNRIHFREASRYVSPHR